MTVRKYSSRSQKTTLASSITSSSNSITVVSASSLLGGVTISAGQTFTVVIDPDTALEEIVDIYSASGNPVSGNTLAIARNVDGSVAQNHSAGAEVRHMAIGRDYREANEHIENTTTAHGLTLANVTLTTGTGNVSTQMLAANAVTTAKITDANVTTAKIADSAITSAKIADLTIATGDIADSAITSGKIATGAVGTTKIDDLSITTAKVVDGAITSAKILDGTITSTDIANDTIVDADINTAANIAWTKIAPSATVSATELGYLDGVTSAIQPQIDSKLATSTATSTYAPLASPALTGTPTAPTAAANTNTTQIATTAYVQTELADLVNSAPAALDTLNELAASLGNDANFATTVTNSLAGKLSLTGGTMSGAIAMGTNKITGLGTPTASTDAATKNYVDTVTIAPSNLTGPITSVGSATSVASQTGTGSTFVMDTSPTLVTPALGVATATSVNGTTIPTSKTLVVTTDKLSTLAATTSAELASVISDETGSGALVFGTSPLLTTPVVNTVNATASNSAPSLWGNVNGGSIVIGGGLTTGSMLLAGNNTFSGTLGLATGGGTTSRTINIGTGTTGGTTTVNIGSTAGATNAITVNGGLTVRTPAAATVAAVVRGAASQSANLQQWQNSSSTVLASVNSSGQFVGDGSQLTGITSLPSQTSNAGKYLTTDGTTASWATVTTDPTADIFMMMGA